MNYSCMLSISMQPDFWLQKWELGDIPFHQEEINSNLCQYFHTMNLHPNETLLVPLCGKTKDLLFFTQHQLNVIGVELSPIACHDFFAEMQLKPSITPYKNFLLYQYKNIKIFCGDFFNLSPDDLPTIHGVYDCKALIALPKKLRKKYVNHLLKCVGHYTNILLIIISTNNSVISPPFPINFSEINLLYKKKFNIQSLITRKKTNFTDDLILKGFKEIIENVILLTPK